MFMYKDYLFHISIPQPIQYNTIVKFPAWCEVNLNSSFLYILSNKGMQFVLRMNDVVSLVATEAETEVIS